MTRCWRREKLVVLREGRRSSTARRSWCGPARRSPSRAHRAAARAPSARALATLIEPDAGSVLLDGPNARRFAPTRFRTRVAFLAQQPCHVRGTVRDNLEAGPALHGKLPRRRAIAGVDRSGRARRVILVRQAATLSAANGSGSPWRARWPNASEVLLLDEPTAALDPEAGERVVALLRDLSARGLSVVLITHVEAHAPGAGRNALPLRARAAGGGCVSYVTFRCRASCSRWA